MRLVLDASAALSAVLKKDERLLATIESASVVYAPDLFAAEVTNGLWKYVTAGQLSADDAADRLELAQRLVDRYLPVDDFSKEALSEATRYGHPVYDLCYAVAARREACSVLTIDQRLRKLLRRMKIPIA